MVLGRAGRLRNLKRLTIAVMLTLAVTWLILAGITFLLSATIKSNLELRQSVYELEKCAAPLKEDAEKFREFKMAKEKFEEGAVDYLEWQFVLKSETQQARQRLSEEIKKIKGLKTQDKGLLNLLYYNLGLGCILSMDFPSAISAFEEALKYNSKDAHSYYSLGLLYSTYRQSAQNAAKYYKKYLELEPSGSKAKEVKDRLMALERK